MMQGCGATGGFISTGLIGFALDARGGRGAGECVSRYTSPLMVDRETFGLSPIWVRDQPSASSPRTLSIS
jgi:hypothetical protein